MKTTKLVCDKCGKEIADNEKYKSLSICEVEHDVCYKPFNRIGDGVIWKPSTERQYCLSCFNELPVL